MNLTDPVADFLTRIRNAYRARHQKLDAPASRLKSEIARILKEEGYIANYKPAEENGQKVIRVYLKYGPNNEAVIKDLQRVSKPGCRVYLGKEDIKRVQGGLGISIMDDPEGRHDRPAGPPRGCRRRDSLRSLVTPPRSLGAAFVSAAVERDTPATRKP